MTLENVLSGIQKDAELEALRIINSGKDEASLIIKEALREAERIKTMKTREAEEKLRELERIQQSKVRMKYKRKRLESEKAMIDTCWVKIRKEIESIDPDLNRELLKKILHIAKATPAFSIRSVVARGEDEELTRPYYLYSREQDKDIVTDLSDLEYASSIVCIGGIIAEEENSNWRVNLTYDIILDEIYEETLGKVYDILLGD